MCVLASTVHFLFNIPFKHVFVRYFQTKKGHFFARASKYTIRGSSIFDSIQLVKSINCG